MAEEFTLAPMRRLLKRIKSLRVSEGASEEFRRVIGELSLRIAEDAIANAEKEGRRTVLLKDIKVAEKRFLERR